MYTYVHNKVTYYVLCLRYLLNLIINIIILLYTCYYYYNKSLIITPCFTFPSIITTTIKIRIFIC